MKKILVIISAIMFCFSLSCPVSMAEQILVPVYETESDSIFSTIEAQTKSTAKKIGEKTQENAKKAADYTVKAAKKGAKKTGVAAKKAGKKATNITAKGLKKGAQKLEQGADNLINKTAPQVECSCNKTDEQKCNCNGQCCDKE